MSHTRYHSKTHNLEAFSYTSTCVAKNHIFSNGSATKCTAKLFLSY